MPPLSSIKRLPPAIKEKIDNLLAKNHTLDEIIEALDQLDLEDMPSRSALGRYKKDLKKISERVMRTRHVAEALATKFGDEPGSSIARVNIEVLHSLVLEMLTGGEDDEPVTLEPQKAMFAAKALQSLASASKTDNDRIEQELEARLKQLKREMADHIEKVADKSGGLSALAVEKIRSEVLGVR